MEGRWHCGVPGSDRPAGEAARISHIELGELEYICAETRHCKMPLSLLREASRVRSGWWPTSYLRLSHRMILPSARSYLQQQVPNYNDTPRYSCCWRRCR